jgi:hypothetical protein
MTIEIASLIAGAILVSALIWQFHRITSRQLSEIQGEVSALRDVVSRVFLMQVAHKTEKEPSNLDVTPPPSPDPTAKNDRREDDALHQLEMEFEAAEIDELCAKLITLVPPEEAAPLLWSARPWPKRKNDH